MPARFNECEHVGDGALGVKKMLKDVESGHHVVWIVGPFNTRVELADDVFAAPIDYLFAFGVFDNVQGRQTPGPVGELDQKIAIGCTDVEQTPCLLQIRLHHR